MTIRIVATADHHFATGSRWETNQAVHDWIVDIVRDLKPTCLVSAGDLYDRASNPEEREFAATWLQQIATVCPVYGVKGNHDRPRDVAILNRLQSRHPIVITEDVDVRVVGGVALALMAWPEPAWLAARARVAGDELDQEARAQLRTLLLGLGAQLQQHDGPRLAVGHWMIDGSVASTGQPLIGMPLNVGLADIALLGADAVLAGHIHNGTDANEWTIERKPVLYPGSPASCNYGETEVKSVVLLEWRGDHFTVERIPTPSPRMLHLESEWFDCIRAPGDRAESGLTDPLRDFCNQEPTDVRGAECRLRYRTPSDRRDEARREAEKLRDLMLAAGALSVKLEPQLVAETRARSPEVARAKSLAEQVEAFWRSKGFEPGSRREPMLSKLNELEVSYAQ